MTKILLSHRPLLDFVLWELWSDYFKSMPNGSGFLAAIAVQTREIEARAVRPGDIDLLLLPYEQNELVLERAMALEIKIVRASFLRQNKSPNDFGFSQSEALIKLGFPYVGLAHLVISDASPRDAWRATNTARLLGRDDEASDLSMRKADMLPADLIRRAAGRLRSNSRSDKLGLIAAYLDVAGKMEGQPTTWIPKGRPAEPNKKFNTDLMSKVGAFYLSNEARFIAISRH